MNRIKKFGLPLIALTLGLSLLAGCGGGSASASGNDSAPAAQQSDSAQPADTQANPADSGDLSGKISTNGSTSMEKVIGALSEAFMGQNPGVSITYDPTGSGSGITAVSEGTADIGLSSRSLKDSETGLDATVIALDGIAIVIHADNPVENLTLEQLHGLATGEIDNWSAVGGNDAPVVMIGREASSGTRDGFESIVGVADECAYEQELTSTGAVIAAVASNEYAIGYASLSSVGDGVKAVSVEGVTPSESTVLDGSYPVQRPFVFVTRSGETLDPQIQAFIDFVLSADATGIISDAGAVQAK